MNQDTFYWPKHDQSLLSQRKQQLAHSMRMLSHYEDRLSRKPNDAMLLCEVDRYRCRVDAYTLAVQTLSKVQEVGTQEGL